MEKIMEEFREEIREQKFRRRSFLGTRLRFLGTGLRWR